MSCDNIFSDDFESGDPIGTLYDASGFGNPTVSAGVGRGGGFGVECTGGSQSGQIRNTAAFAPGVRTGCCQWDLWLSSDGLSSIGSPYWFRLVATSGTGGIWGIEFSGASAPYTLTAYDHDGNQTAYPGVVPGGEWFTIKAEWRLSASPSAADGIVRVYIGTDEDSLVLIHEDTSLDDFGISEEWAYTQFQIDLEGFLDNIKVGDDTPTLPVATLPAFPTGYRILARVDLEHVDSNGDPQTFTYGPMTIWDAEGKLALAKVLSFGWYERAKSGLYGDVPIGSAKILLSDTKDRTTDLMTFRGWLDQASQYGVLNITGTVWAISEEDWRAQKAWLPVFTGVVGRYTLGRGFEFGIDLKDWWETRLTEPFPLRTLFEDFPAVPAGNRDLYGAIVAGRHSDEASATAAPTLATETVSGTELNGATGDWLAGYGELDGTAPTGLTTVEQTSSGNLDTGVWPSDDIVVMVAPINAGVVGEPSPRVPGDESVTLSMNGSAVLATCTDTGDDAYRFFFGYRATNKIEWTQYKDTTDPATGVVCTDMPAPGVDPTSANITSGFTPVYTTSIWYGQRVAVMPDGLTAASIELLAINSPFLRPRRIVTTPIAGAISYYDYWHEAGQPAAFRYPVPAGQVNGAGDVYGDSDMSFVNAEAVDGTPTPQGRVKGEVIGTFTSLEGVPMVAVSFACHPINVTDFEAMYFRQSDGTVTPVDGVGSNPAFGTDIFAPGQSGFTTKWGATPYRAGATGQRHFVCYFLGPWGDRVAGTQDPADAVGEVEVWINITAGVEATGDATGTGITDGYDQLAWLLDNYGLANTPHSQAGGGDWTTSVPTWPDGRVRRDADSFTTTKTEAATEIPGGGARSFVIKDAETFGAVVKRLLQGIDADLGQNIVGAFRLDLLPPTTSSSSVEAVDHITNVLDASFETHDDDQELWNVLPYQYDLDPWAGSYRGVPDPVEDADSIAIYKRRRTAPSGTFDLSTVANPSVAAQIMDRARQRHRKPARLVVYERGIEGISLDIGDRYTLTHPEGATASGYVSRRMRVQKVRLDLDNDKIQVWSTDRDWIGRDLTTWEQVAGMQIGTFGGEREASAVAVGSPAVIMPRNRRTFRHNWDEHPSSVPVVARVHVATDQGTVTPYVALEASPETPVVSGTVVSSSTVAEQDITIPASTGIKRYVLAGEPGGSPAPDASDVTLFGLVEGRIGE